VLRLVIALALAFDERTIRLPPSPVGAAWEAVGPETLPRAGLAADWPAWSERGPAAWGASEPWRRWVALLCAEASAARADPARRAALAVLARRQGRYQDAWTHASACAESPEVLAALVPRLALGLDASAPLGAGATILALPDGVRLAPALPPEDPALGAGIRALIGQRLEVAALAVGSAQIALTLEVEPDGLSIDLRHLSGGSARVQLELPLPAQVAFEAVYADWERSEESERVLTFTLDAEEPEHSAWARFAPLAHGWPTARPPATEAGAPHLTALASWVVLQEAGPALPHLVELSRTLEALFGCPCAFACGSQPPLESAREPLVLRFRGDTSDEPKLSSILSLAEAWALAGARR
jgi:hypothetical protein